MKIEAFTELVRRNLAGGDIAPSFPIKNGDIHFYCETVISELVFKALVEAASLEGDSFGPWGGLLENYDNISVQLDSTRKLSYIDLPVGVIQLPKDKGIARINQPGGKEEVLLTDVGYLHKMEGLEAAILNPYIMAWVEGDRIYFDRDLGDDCKMRVLLLPALSDLDPEKTLNLPGHLLRQLLIEAVTFGRQALGLPTDRTIDSSPITAA